MQRFVEDYLRFPGPCREFGQPHFFEFLSQSLDTLLRQQRHEHFLAPQMPLAIQTLDSALASQSRPNRFRHRAVARHSRFIVEHLGRSFAAQAHSPPEQQAGFEHIATGSRADRAYEVIGPPQEMECAVEGPLRYEFFALFYGTFHRPIPSSRFGISVPSQARQNQPARF